MINNSIQQESPLKKRVLAVFSILLFFVIVIVLLDFRIYPYSDDLAYITPLSFDSRAQLFAWAFEQHVDHTIPLQKLLHYFVLSNVGYDFRVLVILNAFIALLTTLALLRAAELFRGNTRWGDALIPLLVLNPSLQYSLWAFQFQFLSSVFFASVFLYFALSRLAGGGRIYAYGAFLALLLAALCGMNGLVFSVVVTGGCLLWYLAFRHKQHHLHQPTQLHTPYIIATLVLVAVQAYVLLQWTPSAASSSGFQLLEAAKAFLILQVSALSIYTFSSTFLKAGIMAVVVAVVLAAYALNWRRRLSHLPSVILVLALVATEMVLASIAVGRSKVQGGVAGILIMHYGVLTILVPALVWMSFEKSRSWWKEAVVSVLVIVIGATAYKTGAGWRLDHERAIYQTRADVHARLNSEANLESLVDDHIAEFYWIQDEPSKKIVVDALEQLRQAGYRHYRLLSPVAPPNP